MDLSLDLGHFGRWAWDGYLFGAPFSGPGLSLIDVTYNYGFAAWPVSFLPTRSAVIRHSIYSTAYNAAAANGPSPPGPVLFQLPAFVDNIAGASEGTVTVGPRSAPSPSS